MTQPTYTDPAVSAGLIVRAVHFAESRAIIAIE